VTYTELKATEALSLAFDLALPRELDSGVTAPLFRASLVDYYKQVAHTEEGVQCRLETVTAPSTADAEDSAGQGLPIVPILSLISALLSRTPHKCSLQRGSS
jgi:hypothetical protein